MSYRLRNWQQRCWSWLRLQHESRALKGHTHVSSGVVYIATGHDYIVAAAMSIGSLRRVYRGNVMLLTDTNVSYLSKLSKYLDVDVLVHGTKEAHAGRSSRILKTQVASLCPYSSAIFLDADTLVFKPIDALWKAPTAAKPIAMTTGLKHPTVGTLNDPQLFARPDIRFAEEYKLTLAAAGPDAPYYSSSTMSWKRTPELLELFRVWHQEWSRIRVSDMPALARALAITGVGVVLLSSCFNARDKLKSDTVIFTARSARMRPVYEKFPELYKTVNELLRG